LWWPPAQFVIHKLKAAYLHLMTSQVRKRQHLNDPKNAVHVSNKRLSAPVIDNAHCKLSYVSTNHFFVTGSAATAALQ